ncbi:MAG: RND family efflux transporter MFP subunit [Halioglobus sp.]|jgi:RND family efflux transporter MFP subunit
MKTTITRVLMPILVLASSIGAYAILHAAKPPPEKSEEGPRPISVYTQSVRQEPVSLKVTTQGDVRARTQIDLVTQVGGRVVWVSSQFTEGGEIEPGASLLKIEDEDYRLALSQAKANVAEAKVGVEQALADADVARKQLRNTPNPSPLALKKPQVAQAQSRLVAARANLDQSSLNLQRTSVSLPFKGRLISTRVDVGQYVTPGTIIGRAFATKVVEIRLPLNDSQLSALGLPIGYTAPEGEELDVNFSAEVAGKIQQWHGKLLRLDASIDPATRMLYASAMVLDPYGKNISSGGMPMAVGLFVEAEISGRELPNAYTIPRSALRAGELVFLIKEGQLEVRKVTVTHSSSARAIISEGLALGEKVIVSPIRNPIQGMALTEVENNKAN